MLLDKGIGVIILLIINMNLPKKHLAGFTLIELLIVIGILGVLMAIVLVALNPARQFAQANDTKRASDVNAILNAIHQYAAEKKGQLPAGISATDQEICGAAAGCANLCAVLVPTYIAQLPVDPLVNDGIPVNPADCATTYATGYWVQTGANNRVTVRADAPEIPGAVIQVTR